MLVCGWASDQLIAEFKMTDTKSFTLTLLRNQHYTVDRQLFQRKEFRASTPRPGTDPRAGLLRTPLCSLDVSFFGSDHQFNDISKAFENQSIMLNEPHLLLSGEMKVKDFQAAALLEFPGEKISKAYDLYARKVAKKPYTQLLQDQKDRLMERFLAAFEDTSPEHPMIRSRFDLGLHNQNVFTHAAMDCSDEALQTYQSLASEGHVYSQYLAGLLTGTYPGGYSPKCIPFLIDAYRNEHPDALNFLAEFLLVKEDYLGSLQCALLSIDSGQYHSRTILKKVMQTTSLHVDFFGNGARMVGHDYLINHVLDANFRRLAEKHIAVSKPEMRTPSFLFTRREQA